MIIVVTETKPEDYSPVLLPGTQCRFNYPPAFTTLPEYTARIGRVVAVVRPCTEAEAEAPSEEDGITQMYIIRDEDGWQGEAWSEELEVIK